MSDERSSGDDDGLSWDDSRERRERLSRDEIHSILASDRRRAILSYLRRRPDQPVKLDTLVGVCLGGGGGNNGARAKRLQLEADLHHAQLPALDAAGVVRYDANEGTVEYRPSERLEKYQVAIEAIDAMDRDAE